MILLFDFADAVNPNGIKIFLANSSSTFFIKGKLLFSNCLKDTTRSPPDCPIYCDLFFHNFYYLMIIRTSFTNPQNVHDG